jgi:hypothetical protein
MTKLILSVCALAAMSAAAFAQPAKMSDQQLNTVSAGRQVNVADIDQRQITLGFAINSTGGCNTGSGIGGGCVTAADQEVNVRGVQVVRLVQVNRN